MEAIQKGDTILSTATGLPFVSYVKDTARGMKRAVTHRKASQATREALGLLLEAFGSLDVFASVPKP